ncbi:unnamed protein product, partial [Mesorhabditis belari]|uniref:Uncharacterized protein n=1 Tax=Mesorhabditis belari TaxID=2138241 RepID=A0AAF3FBQ7_9BILA
MQTTGNPFNFNQQTASQQLMTVEGTQMCPRCGPITYNHTATSAQIFAPYMRPIDLVGTVPICEVQLLTDVSGGMVLDLNVGSASRYVFCGLDGQWYVMQGSTPLIIKSLICYAYNPTPQFPSMQLPSL